MSAVDESSRLQAYLDGELDEAAAQALEARLSLDPQARAEADALRQAWGLLDYLPKAEPSPTFTHRTLERLSVETGRPSASTATLATPRPRRRHWAPLGWAAAILLALGVGGGSGFGLARLLRPPAPPPPPAATDEAMARHPRVVEKWRTYEQAGDLDCVRRLAEPDYFGDEPGG